MSIVSTNKVSKNEGPIVWKYFKKAKDNATCDICSNSLVYTNGMTSNLLRHLKRHKGKVPELNKSNVKSGANVLEMLKTCQYEPFDQQKFTNMAIYDGL
ncbi:22642_t:CDS:2 [Gigaspora margarita]|uniref:22642_t:CDS:1 n=1 Tax=Gigaspora margarita TaxID=4874 RepID=A0ABN7URQ2_GIGMA|nr:22642_t:CDS:2 [Gigaspora margarita]